MTHCIFFQFSNNKIYTWEISRSSTRYLLLISLSNKTFMQDKQSGGKKNYSFGTFEVFSETNIPVRIRIRNVSTPLDCFQV